MKLSGDMIIADILELDRETIPIFMNNGLHCLGCSMASGETIEEACIVHGIDLESLLQQLNEHFNRE